MQKIKHSRLLGKVVGGSVKENQAMTSILGVFINACSSHRSDYFGSISLKNAIIRKYLMESCSSELNLQLSFK